MDFPQRYTKHQVPRGTRADAERNGAMFLIKNVSTMRLTYQIRLLTLRAVETRRKLLIDVPAICKVHPMLREFVRQHSKFVRIEKV